MDPLARVREANMNDELVFRWTNQHNVYLLESEDKFNACDFTNATLVGEVSPTTYNVTQFPAYFSCKIGSHCQNGMKLKVTEGKSFIKYCIVMYYIYEAQFRH